MKALKSRRQHLKSMHGEFSVIPNAWNVGEFRQLEKLGFGAIATKSAGLSASMGRDDLSLTCDKSLLSSPHVRAEQASARVNRFVEA